jgi:hypothetical protein
MEFRGSIEKLLPNQLFLSGRNLHERETMMATDLRQRTEQHGEKEERKEQIRAAHE